MDFDSPDVMKDFPGLYASELNRQCSDSDYSDENDRVVKKDILIGKRKEKKDKERGYAALEGESSADENFKSRSPSKAKKSKSFKFSTKTKDKRDKSRDKDKDIEKKKDRDKKYEKKIDKEKIKSDKVKKLKSTDDQGDIGDVLPIFGVNLSVAVEVSRCHDGIDIPLPVRQCIDHIEDVGLTFEGLYKISGTKSKVVHIKKMYNQRENVNLGDYDIPTVTSLLKTFLRDLPEPLFTNDFLIRFEEAGAILSANTREKHLKILLDNLPPVNRLLLSWLIVHLSNVSLSERCKMSKQSIAAALNHTFHCSSRLLSVLLHHSHTLFSNVSIVRYVPPLESGAVLPEEPQQIEEELAKQESLLNQIHREMNFGCISKQREELLWEVQRIITQLKRTLKNVNKDRELIAEKATPADPIDCTLTDEKKEDKSRSIEPPPDNKTQSNSNQEREQIICDTIPEIQDESIDEDSKTPPPPPPTATEIVCDNPPNKDCPIKATAPPQNTVFENKLRLLQLKNDGLHELKDSLWERIETERLEIGQLREQLSNEAPSLPIVPEENLDDLLNLIIKENQLLQIKKVNLVRQIIEEEEMCIELRAQLLLKA